MMRVNVEEGVGLRADKVVGGRGATSCDADRLRQTKDALKWARSKSATTSAFEG